MFQFAEPSPPPVMDPVADSLPLPPIEPSHVHVHVHSAPQPTEAPSAFPTVAGIKVGNEGENASPSVTRPIGSTTMAIEGEGGLAFVEKMMAEGGPAKTGKVSHSCLIPIFQVLIYTPPQQIIYIQPITYFAKTSNSCQPNSNLPVSRFRHPKRTSRSSLPLN